jgi:2-oxoisovalerate dehydrogenase E1 component
VREANRVLVVTEEDDLTSFGRHLHSWVVQNCFYDLDSTPELISALPAPPAPYNGPEETAFFPTAYTIEAKIANLLQE